MTTKIKQSFNQSVAFVVSLAPLSAEESGSTLSLFRNLSSQFNTSQVGEESAALVVCL
jgi:hypothetical protein